jgi:hypothetical protein
MIRRSDGTVKKWPLRLDASQRLTTLPNRPRFYVRSRADRSGRVIPPVANGHTDLAVRLLLCR